MWGILTDMVSTRRSSARLQEKQSSSASVPSSPTPSATSSVTGVSPSTRRATKASPPSATRTTGRRATPPTKASPGSGAKRGRPRKNAAHETVAEDNETGGSEDASATQSDDTATDHGSAAEESAARAPVNKQLFVEETKTTVSITAAKDSDSEPDVEVVEQQEEQVTAVVVEEPEAEPEVAEEQEEEEEEIVMMDTSEDDEEEKVAAPTAANVNQKDEDEEGEDDEDFDVTAFAQMAASGVNLSITATSNSSSATGGAASSTGGIHLVPDALDSGAASRTKFLEFEGTKLALGAKVVTATASVEEQKVLKQQLGKVEKANRQRVEAQNVSTAGRKWFDMSTHEMDADARRDFALLKMRNYLDPKKFYKTSDHTKKMPKHFQFGTVIEGAHEFKSARLTKKERKQTFTEEIMADNSIRSYTKRVFLQVQNSRAGGHGKKKQKRF